MSKPGPRLQRVRPHKTGAEQTLLTNRAMAEAFVRDLYQEMHERRPDATELAGWADQLQRGLLPEQMRDIVLNSAEHQAKLQTDAMRAAVVASGLFDARWYLHRYRDVASAGQDALRHYLLHGWREDRAPNAWFDPAWYRSVSGISSDEPALLHYVRHGEALGLAPCADFDPKWYRTAGRLDTAASPLADFLAHRHDGRVAPCARLWSAAGLLAAKDGDVETDPFRRFVDTATESGAVATADNRLLLESRLFDANFYALHSSDVMEAQMDPLDHFCEFGWREGRQPNFYFNPCWYLATNPEVGRLEVNPLVHYLLVGEPAGRRPIVFFDPEWYRSAYDIAPFGSPLAHYLAHRRSQKYSPHPLFDPAYYMARSEARVFPRRDPFSHFLIAGMQRDVPPSPAFDPGAWRRRTRGRPTRWFKNLLSPEKDNPLINYLLATYH